MATSYKQWEPYSFEPNRPRYPAMDPLQIQVPAFASPLEASIIDASPVPTNNMAAVTTCKRQINSMAMIHRTPPTVSAVTPPQLKRPQHEPTAGCSRTIPLSWSATTTTSQIRQHHQQRCVNYGTNGGTETHVTASSASTIVQVSKLSLFSYFQAIFQSTPSAIFQW